MRKKQEEVLREKLLAQEAKKMDPKVYSRRSYQYIYIRQLCGVRFNLCSTLKDFILSSGSSAKK